MIPRVWRLRQRFIIADTVTAWVYVYLNGQWQLLDPLFDTYMPSQEEIYQWYYPWYTEGVIPYYNGMNMKLLDGTYYINGNFMQYRNGMMIHEYYGLPGGEIWIFPYLPSVRLTI